MYQGKLVEIRTRYDEGKLYSYAYYGGKWHCIDVKADGEPDLLK